jgi:hypothetical protein
MGGGRQGRGETEKNPTKGARDRSPRQRKRDGYDDHKYYYVHGSMMMMKYIYIYINSRALVKDAQLHPIKKNHYYIKSSLF